MVLLANRLTKRTGCFGLMACMLATNTACFHPPYNNFQESHRDLKYPATGLVAGTAAGALLGALAGYTGVGAVAGGVIGSAIGLSKTTKNALIADLLKYDIQFEQYGDTMTLIVPTDRYFVFNSPHLSDLCYDGLNDIVKLLKHYPCSQIYIASFTDDVGSRYHKKMLSQARAESMLTFLWANNISAQRLQADGYGDKHDVGDNQLIHGSAHNRRLEIQWANAPAVAPAVAYSGK